MSPLTLYLLRARDARVDAHVRTLLPATHARRALRAPAASRIAARSKAPKPLAPPRAARPMPPCVRRRPPSREIQLALKAFVAANPDARFSSALALAQAAGLATTRSPVNAVLRAHPELRVSITRRQPRKS